MQRSLVAVLALVLVLSIGSHAEQQPKVMNFIAVMDLNCGTALNKEECAALTDIVIEELVKTKKYTVIDRLNRDKILAEQGFQQTGCVDDSCSVEAGRLLGVGKLVVGKITKLGDTYLVALQIVNVQTGAVETSASERCKCDQAGLIDAVVAASRKLMGEAPSTTAPGTTLQQPAPTNVGEMVSVPAGEFIMGSDSASGYAKPAHRVYLDAYYIDKFEVTNEQYRQCVNSGKCSESHSDDSTCWVIIRNTWQEGILPQSFRESNQPVVCVDWNQAKSYCEYAGKRLPTEAEWEKAARGTDGRTYPWGEGIDCNKANYKDCNIGKTKPVGSYPSGASPYGAMDMAGNVSEWATDWFDGNYYQISPNRNPTGPSSGSKRVRRGGNWEYHYGWLLVWLRNWASNPTSRAFDNGFRCAKNP